MKTTIEIPDGLFRKAKIKAAAEGLSLRDLFIRGLQLAVQTPPPVEGHRAAFPLIRSAPGAPPLTDDQVAEALNSDEGLL